MPLHGIGQRVKGMPLFCSFDSKSFSLRDIIASERAETTLDVVFSWVYGILSFQLRLQVTIE